MILFRMMQYLIIILNIACFEYFAVIGEKQ